MSFCLPPPHIGFVWGLESIVSYDHSNTSFTLGLVVIGIFLILQALVLALYPSGYVRGVYVTSGLPDKEEADSLNRRAHPAIQMRWIVVGYSAITGVFAWLRAAFDTGKPLLIGAALHNLAEFCMLVNLYFSYRNVSKYQRVGFIVVTAIITAVIISPSFKMAVFIEQQFGVLFDYTLLLTFYHLYQNPFDNAASEDTDPVYQQQFAELWKLGLIGATSHFGQIWTLIMGALGIGSGTWVQWAIEGTLYFSAPVTFLYYAWFALEWDRMVETDIRKTVSNYSASIAIPIANGNGDYSSLKSNGRPQSHRDELKVNEGSSLLPNSAGPGPGSLSPLRKNDAELRFVGKRLAIAVALALATIVGPALLPRCAPSTAVTTPIIANGAVGGMVSAAAVTPLASGVPIPGSYCPETDGSLSGLTLVTAKSKAEFPALVDAMTPLIEYSRSTPGNIHYDVLQHVDGIHLTFYEKWASRDILTAHIASEGVQKVFRDPYVQSLMASETLNGPYVSTELCTEVSKLHVAFNFQLKNTVQVVYDTLSNVKDCSWIIGCTGVDIVDFTHRSLKLGSKLVIASSVHGQQINPERTNATYSYSIDSVLTPSPTVAYTDYSAKVLLQQSAKSTAAAPLVDVEYIAELNAVDKANPQAREVVLAFYKNEFQKNRIPFLQQLFDKKN